MQTPTSVKNKRFSWLRRHKALTIMIVVLVFAVGSVQAWHLDRQHQIASEKARFAQADHDIDDLSAKIVATVGEPLKTEKTKSCSRPHLKLQEGELSCRVGVDIFFKITNLTSANAMRQTVSDTVSNRWTNTNSSYSNNIVTDKWFIDKLEKQYIYETFTADNSLDCRITYGLYPSQTPPYKGYPTSDDSPYVIAISPSCSGDATIQHYPLNS